MKESATALFKIMRPYFYRTRYLNILLKDARHVIVGIWDTDVLVPEKQLMDAINYIQKGCVLSFPL